MIYAGFIIGIAGVIVGFLMAGGELIVLWHPSEIVVIAGITIGMLIIAASPRALSNLGKDLGECFKGGGITKSDIEDLFKLLYELFVIGRRNGLIALDEHVSSPSTSSILTKYPSFLKDHHRVEFLVSALRPAIDGKVKPDQLKELLETEMDAKQTEAHQSVSLLGLIADSLPGIGIVAAVLGIINTMSAISQGPEKVGEKVAAALSGTLLGVWLAYGFVNPLAKKVAAIHEAHFGYFNAMVLAISGFAGGMSPVMAIEIARRGLDPAVQPEGEALESMLKAAVSGAPKA